MIFSHIYRKKKINYDQQTKWAYPEISKVEQNVSHTLAVLHYQL